MLRSGGQWLPGLVLGWGSRQAQEGVCLLSARRDILERSELEKQREPNSGLLLF